jgi:hypothetical protein
MASMAMLNNQRATDLSSTILDDPQDFLGGGPKHAQRIAPLLSDLRKDRGLKKRGPF